MNAINVAADCATRSGGTWANALVIVALLATIVALTWLVLR